MSSIWLSCQKCNKELLVISGDNLEISSYSLILFCQDCKYNSTFLTGSEKPATLSIKPNPGNEELINKPYMLKQHVFN